MAGPMQGMSVVFGHVPADEAMDMHATQLNLSGVRPTWGPGFFCELQFSAVGVAMPSPNPPKKTCWSHCCDYQAPCKIQARATPEVLGHLWPSSSIKVGEGALDQCEMPKLLRSSPQYTQASGHVNIEGPSTHGIMKGRGPM